MKKLITIFFLCLCTIAFAQKHKIDSIKAVLSTHAKNDTLKVSSLNELSYFYAQTQPDSALKYGNLGFQLANRLKYQRGKAWALNRIGYAHWMKAKYPTTLRYAYEALEIFEKLKDKKGLANTYNVLAITYGMKDDFQRSLEFYAKFMKISEELEDTFSMLKANANIGRTYFLKKHIQRLCNI